MVIKMKNVLKISFLAPTGCGKTTAARLIEKNFPAQNIKLAAPLYDMQKLIYDRLGIPCEGQDGEFLQFMGAKIQRDYPDFLFSEFLQKEEEILRETQVEIIVNDDCRPHNYLFLKKNGFVFIGIKGKSHLRDDITSIDPKHIVEWQQPLPVDYIVDNTEDILTYEKNLLILIDMLRERC